MSVLKRLLLASVALLALGAVSVAKAQTVDDKILTCAYRASHGVLDLINSSSSNSWIKSIKVAKVLLVQATASESPSCLVIVSTESSGMVMYRFTLEGEKGLSGGGVIDNIYISECYGFRDICIEAKEHPQDWDWGHE